MESRGREQEENDKPIRELQNQILKIRKKKIEKQLINKRLRNAHHKNQPLQNEVMDLEGKEEQEEAKIKGIPFLAKHFRKHKRKSKKRCWYCGDSSHFKRYCQKIQCFKCHRLGHMKADCFMKKIDYLPSELEKMYKRKEKRRISKASKQRNKRQMKEIYKLRAQQSEFIEDMGKWKLKW